LHIDGDQALVGEHHEVPRRLEARDDQLPRNHQERTRAELETRQGWVVDAARLAVAAPWVLLGLLSIRTELSHPTDRGERVGSRQDVRCVSMGRMALMIPTVRAVQVG
jgi:hypothetical protein